MNEIDMTKYKPITNYSRKRVNCFRPYRKATHLPYHQTTGTKSWVMGGQWM